MKVAMLPRSPWWRENPYLSILEAGLRSRGWEVADDPNDGLGWRWLVRERRRVQILHLHWFQYHYTRSSSLSSLLAWVRFSFKLAMARLIGYRIVWTVHNIEPHEARFPRLDFAAGWWLARVANQVIVHCEYVRGETARLFKRTKNVISIPHPELSSPDGSLVSSDEARRRLALGTDVFVYLCIGLIRSYKGFVDAARAFQRLPGGHLRLVIAGRPADAQVEAELRSLAEADERIILRLGYIPDADLPVYLQACDVVIFPFRKVATSGSVTLAMAYARPAIAPSMGCLPEFLADGAGILYDPAEPDGLQISPSLRWRRRAAVATG
jgi:glycosyltransferase involved in cell wall biosynthesis